MITQIGEMDSRQTPTPKGQYSWSVLATVSALAR